jgi:hypothetical protein
MTLIIFMCRRVSESSSRSLIGDVKRFLCLFDRVRHVRVVLDARVLVLLINLRDQKITDGLYIMYLLVQTVIYVNTVGPADYYALWSIKVEEICCSLHKASLQS